ncbi:MAG TPA: AIR synthase related protein [Nocardioides sp.]|uniref:AIR synthase related protein n=1 Tax=Nocardioides sp. TaxID=35761 RepID=UPI002E347955|nr:AIR synthase related protein [Nocardioides sp.]HEX5087765.1 AIR synthase related protein [Nocardioides sp.]
MSTGGMGERELAELAGFLQSHPALRAKNEIKLVSEVLGAASWVHGPGDDGAVVGPPAGSSPLGGDGEHVIACGEALLPAFVAADPYGAGIAAVLANVNDLAAMGAVPQAIVDTIVGSPELARETLRGMSDACGWYDVVLAGGHLTLHDGAPAVSAFGVGRAAAVLSTTNVAPGQSLIAAACTTGTLRPDFPFFRSFEERVGRMGGDVRVLASLAGSGACVAAKDVSMAGLVGSLAMLLEWSRLGVTLDLERLPAPVGLSMQDWLTCFPAYAFLLCAPPGREDECLSAFQTRGLEAAVVGVVDESGLLALRSGRSQATVIDLRLREVTGLAR